MKTRDEVIAELKAAAQPKPQAKTAKERLRHDRFRARVVGKAHQALVRAKLDGAPIEDIIELEAQLEELLEKYRT